MQCSVQTHRGPKRAFPALEVCGLVRFFLLLTSDLHTVVSLIIALEALRVGYSQGTRDTWEKVVWRVSVKSFRRALGIGE